MIHFQTFIIYSISVITIIIIDRRKSIIKINFLIKTWGAKKLIFIKRSIPMLMTLHIITIKSIQRRHANNITTIMSVVQIIKLHRLFDFLFKHFMSQLKVELIKLSHKGWEGRCLDQSIYTIYSPGLERTRLGLPCNRPSRNSIEQEVLLLLADEYRPTCSFSMTNPGSLTMGFAEADPRQLAPSVGTTQVGITISAVPPSANQDPTAITTSSPLEEFKFTTSICIAPSRSL